MESNTDEQQLEPIDTDRLEPDAALEPTAQSPLAVDPNDSDAVQAAPSEEPAYQEPAADEEEVPEQIEGIIEALLFTSHKPVTGAKLSMAMGVRIQTVESALERLRARYTADQRGITLENLGGGWQLLSNGAYADWVERLHTKEIDGRLSPAALETLAVVAYRQPVLRADIEAIRGVQVGAILKSLMDKDLVRITGRAELLGRPMLYGTTKRFLDHFGLPSLNDLPNIRELQEP